MNIPKLWGLFQKYLELNFDKVAFGWIPQIWIEQIMKITLVQYNQLNQAKLLVIECTISVHIWTLSGNSCRSN